MAILTDKEHLTDLQRIVGRRLRAARIAADCSEKDAAKKLKQKGISQVSQWENGKRLPPLQSLMLLAELYGVSVDYLLGRLDDPSADPMELSGAAVAGSVAASMGSCLSTITEMLATHAVSALAYRRLDRTQLENLARDGSELAEAFRRFEELNPEFEGDMRGGSRLKGVVGRIGDLARSVKTRHAHETRVHQEMIDDMAAVRLGSGDDAQVCIPMA